MIRRTFHPHSSRTRNSHTRILLSVGGHEEVTGPKKAGYSLGISEVYDGEKWSVVKSRGGEYWA